VLTERVRRDLKASAGANGVLSKAEQAAAPAYVRTIADVRDGMDSQTTFKLFTIEAEAERYQDPRGRRVRWRVRTSSDLLENTYVSGRNDLWNQRFEIDKLSGAITITGEH